jgi:flavin reductase
MSTDSQFDFRQAMSRVGAAVHVITTIDGNNRHGLTASAVSSVTDAPPMLLFCMNRSTSSHGAFRVGGPACINTLAADQKEVSAAFADREKLAVRFDYGRWTTLQSGAPALEGAAACFDGRISNIVDVGTHSVIFVEVIAARCGDKPVLIYMGRAYHQVPHMNELLD